MTLTTFHIRWFVGRNLLRKCNSYFTYVCFLQSLPLFVCVSLWFRFAIMCVCWYYILYAYIYAQMFGRQCSCSAVDTCYCCDWNLTLFTHFMHSLSLSLSHSLPLSLSHLFSTFASLPVLFVIFFYLAKWFSIRIDLILHDEKRWLEKKEECVTRQPRNSSH